MHDLATLHAAVDNRPCRWSGRAPRGHTNAVSGSLISRKWIYRHCLIVQHVLSRSTRPVAAVQLLGSRAAAAAQDSTGCSQKQSRAFVRVQQSGRWSSALLNWPAQATSTAPRSSCYGREHVLAWTTRSGLLAASSWSVATVWDALCSCTHSCSAQPVLFCQNVANMCCACQN